MGSLERSQLSALTAAVADLSERCAEIAGSLEGSGASEAVTALYEAERSLRGAERSLDRAERSLRT